MRQARHGLLGWGVIALVLVAPVVLILAHVGRAAPTPHDVPVVVQAPGVVAQGIVERLDRLEGSPVLAQVVAPSDDPRVPVRQGEAVAALVVHLESGQDTLLVSSVLDPETTGLLERLAVRVGTPLDRSFQTVEVEPPAHARLPRSAIVWTCTGWVAGGLVLALAWSAVVRRRGPPQPLAVLLLVLGTALLSLLVTGPVALAYDVSPLSWWLIGFLTTAATALATAALEELAGVMGVAVAGTLLFCMSAPLLTGRDPLLLPTVWHVIAPWTLHGAAQELSTSVLWFDTLGGARPLLVLGGVLLAGLTVLMVLGARSRTERSPETYRDHPLTGVLVALVPAVLAVLGATVLAPAPAVDVSASAVKKAAETTCVPVPEITDLAGLNAFAGTMRGGSAFQGADVGADVLLQDGRRLWVFGDTLRSADFEGQRFVRNSMLVFGPGCARTVVPADHGALIPDRPDGIGYWPMSIARIQRDGYDLVGVATQRVKSTRQPDGADAFVNLGPSMSVFIVVRGQTPQLIGHEDIGADDRDSSRPEWGAAASVHDGWVYLYGTARPDEAGVFGFSLRVARVRPESLLEREDWRFWDGKTWQRSAARAAELIPATRGVSQTLSVFPRGDRWFAVSKRDEFLGTDLVVWSAPSPTGPFDAGTTVAQLPSNVAKGQLRYMPLAHPDLVPEKGSVVVSYSRNNTDTQKVIDDPFLYRPQFLRVRLPAAR